MSTSHACPRSTDTLDPNADNGGDDGTPPPIDYQPLREAGRLAIGWLLDVARAGATESEDLAAIDRVETAALTRIADLPMCCLPVDLRPSEEDVLVTAGILIERFEIDFRVPGLSQIFGTLYESIDWAQRSTTPTSCGVSPSRSTVNHAAQRHANARIPSWLAMWLSPHAARAPRVAHGSGESAPARILVFPRR